MTWDRIVDALCSEQPLKSCRLSKEQESRARSQLNKFAESIPHHALQTLGDEARFGKAVESRAYTVEVETTWEERYSRRRTRRVGSERIKRPTIDERNLNVWAMNLDDGKDRGIPGEFFVPGSDTLCECPRCDGSGKRRCKTCDHTGEVECHGCSGRKTHQCDECQGKKTVIVSKEVEKKRPCSWCGVSDLVTGMVSNALIGTDIISGCVKCFGKKVESYKEVEETTAECPDCRGAGKVYCSKCDGRGFLRCPVCEGRRVLLCDHCDGCGSIVSFLVVIRSYPTSSERVYTLAPQVPPDLHDRLSSRDYEAVTLFSTRPMRSQECGDGVNGILRGAIQGVLVKSVERTPPSRRAVKQRLTVTAASIIDVRYEYDDEEYTAIFLGRDMRLFSKASPIAQELREMAKKAIKRWKRGADPHVVDDLYSQLEEMGVVDEECRRVLQQLRGELPDMMMQEVRQQRLERVLLLALGLFLAGLGVILSGLFQTVFFLFVPGLMGLCVLVIWRIWYYRNLQDLAWPFVNKSDSHGPLR